MLQALALIACYYMLIEAARAYVVNEWISPCVYLHLLVLVGVNPSLLDYGKRL